VGSRAADVMLVLRDVGEMREKAERPYDLQRFDRRQSVERRFELTPRRDVSSRRKRTEFCRIRSTVSKHSLATMLPDRLAKNSPEQPDVFA
jgi:hypothetical protein